MDRRSRRVSCARRRPPGRRARGARAPRGARGGGSAGRGARRRASSVGQRGDALLGVLGQVDPFAAQRAQPVATHRGGGHDGRPLAAAAVGLAALDPGGGDDPVEHVGGDGREPLAGDLAQAHASRAGPPASPSPQAPRLSSPETLALVAGHSHANLPLAMARVPTDRRIATCRTPRTSSRPRNLPGGWDSAGRPVVISRDANGVLSLRGGSDTGRGSVRGEVQGGSSLRVQNTNVIAVGIEPALLVGHEQRPADAAHRRAARRPQRAGSTSCATTPIAILPAGRLEPALRRLHVLQSALDGRCRIACCQTDAVAAGRQRAGAPRRLGRPGRAVRGAAGRRPAGARARAAGGRRPAQRAAPAPPQAAASARACDRCCPARASWSRPSPSRWSRRCAGSRRRRRPCSTTPATRSPSSRPAACAASPAPPELLAEVFGGARIDEVDAPPGLAGRWRVTQAIEAVAYPTDAERHDAPRPRAPGGTVPVVRRAARGAAMRPLWT